MAGRIPRHIVVLFLLLAGALLLAFAARSWLVDPSYYRFGHYRADAVPELAAPTPRYRGSAYCRTCHTDRNADWALGAHGTVQCEVCHGADSAHPENERTLIPTDTIRLCTTCHLAMPARPAAQPQIVLGQHPFPDEETPQCITCHDPHSPGDMQSDEAAPGEGGDMAGASMSAPAVTSKCAKCHGQQGEGVKKNPALAGLDPEVFTERLNEYKTGARKNKIMAKFANSLSAEDIAELAAFYHSLAAKSAQ